MTARVTVHTPQTVAVTRIADLALNYPMVQPLPDGRVLLVGARSRWRPDGADRNAVIYGPDGQGLAEHTLGDGIEHVVATRDGHVWVGYFDEGVYGNFGWGDAEASAPMGASGLVRFSPDLQPDWQYPSHVDNSWGAISDCYALNVDDETVWTCYYTGFPMVRVCRDVVTGWRNDFSSVRALAARDSRVALCGSGPGRDHLVVGGLSGGRLHTSGLQDIPTVW